MEIKVLAFFLKQTSMYLESSGYLDRAQALGRVFSKTAFIFHNRISVVIPPCQKSRYATYFDVAVLRCLLQPHWSEEGTQWSLMYYLQRLKHMLQEKPEKPPEPEITPLPRPRSSSMVAAAPSLVNTHKTQVSNCYIKITLVLLQNSSWIISNVSLVLAIITVSVIRSLGVWTVPLCGCQK